MRNEITLQEVDTWPLIYRFRGRRDIWACYRRCRQENAARTFPVAQGMERIRRKFVAYKVFGF